MFIVSLQFSAILSFICSVFITCSQSSTCIIFLNVLAIFHSRRLLNDERRLINDSLLSSEAEMKDIVKDI